MGRLVVAVTMLTYGCATPPRAPSAPVAITCGSTESDAMNCGACGHACHGGACRAGRCGPFVLSNEAARVLALVVDDDEVRWVTEDSVLKTVALGGGAPTEVATLELAPADVWVHDDVVFVCDEGGVVRVGRDGRAARVFSGTERCVDLVGDDAHLFFVDDDGIVRALAYAGGEPRFVTKGRGGESGHLEVSGGFVYFGDGQGIVRAPLAGGSVERIVKTEEPLTFALVGDRLVTLEPYTPPNAKNDPGAHATFALFAKDLAAKNDVPHRLALRLLESHGLVGDDRHAYFAEGGSYGAPVRIERADVVRGGVETLVDRGAPTIFALGDNVIVWHDEESHRVMALAK